MIPNIEFFALDAPIPSERGGKAPVPNVPEWAARDYGNRVGIFRLMKVLDRFGVRATAALNSDVCENHPHIIREALARNWEFMGHNQSNTTRLNAVPPGAERTVIADTLSTIAAATGIRPKGWLGAGLQETWSTLEHLADEGVQYVADWVNDDQPYTMTLPRGRRMTSIPYSTQINDKPVFERFHHTADTFRDMICRQFDVLYEEGGDSGRVMAIALHPYVSGVPHRITALSEALAHISGHSDVWMATGGEISDAWRRHCEVNSSARE
ncbi:polysaccharide deacetylase family protein [Roseivivax jejudonensis]|uniref:polysaccharide deacetylase family protein n=1 Tax=Roseivivax jejudonensis TaxID=1529041 RepID=UPI001F45C1B9|nr:polysaccharide deacetylase family protein [Roseivivax jejudonensis]